jgi:hypothetical protein
VLNSEGRHAHDSTLRPKLTPNVRVVPSCRSPAAM